MSPASVTDVPAKSYDIGEHARIVARLLQEYAEKLFVLVNNLLESTKGHHTKDLDRIAWLLDQSEILRKPLLPVLSRACSLEEQGGLDSLAEDELRLRRIETEVHLHHVLRLAHELRLVIDKRKQTESVARLRMAAGLSGMKGGPLRPN